jgi:transposase InsO family protein
MPFDSVSKMDNRRKLVVSVTTDGMSISQASRQAGVSRKTGRKWVQRSKEVGLENLAELSRAPHVQAGRTLLSTQNELLALKGLYPEWGAKKLVVLLEEREDIHLPVRTADRILDRNGLTVPRVKHEATGSFERETCGALFQMDFKGLPKSCPYALLTVLDDHSRFSVHFGPVGDKQGPTVHRALWELFGEYGLPEEMLMDNGDCWGAAGSRFPTRFELSLMRLGIRPIHGRPSHPQTQGKVERFHLTAKTEMGDALIQPNMLLAKQACREFVDRYNWIRPHESLAQVVPGKLFQPWARPRPATPPQHEIPEGALTRKVDTTGIFSFRNKPYRVGKGLIGERIVLQEAELGMRLYYAGFPLLYLHEL